MREGGRGEERGHEGMREEREEVRGGGEEREC